MFLRHATFPGSEPGSDPSGSGSGIARAASRPCNSNLERLSTARQADCKSVLLELGGSIPSLSTNPVGPAWRGERTVNPHAAGSIPAAGATALWCQWLAWLSVEQQDGDRNPVGPPNIFCSGAGHRKSLQDIPAEFESQTSNQARGMLKGKRVTFAR